MSTKAEQAGTRVDPGGQQMDRWLVAGVRIGVAFMWIENSGWKRPPEFSSLRHFTELAVVHPVLPPYSWTVENVILPNLAFFGWITLLLEASLGAFLLVGLLTRLWALIGIAQSVIITVSVLNAPHEWEWSFYLMILAHLALFATAAGRSFGLDGLLRPRWSASSGRVARLLMRLS